MGNALAQSLLLHRNWIVEIDGAGGLHSVLFAKDYLGWDASNGRCYRRDGDSRKVANGAVASQDDRRPAFVRRGKKVETHVSTLYSDGQAASPSQVANSSFRCGCFA